MTVDFTASRMRTLKILLTVTVGLLGLAHILVLPPWEGYDEPAHFSYVQELADSSRPPNQNDRLSADIEQYSGPRPYADLGALRGHKSYAEFAHSENHELGAGPTIYHGAGPPNWEAQHPPLFYWLLVPVYQAAKNSGWKPVLLALRSASWMLALGGLMILAAWTPTTGRRLAISPPIAALLWPLVVPEFFPEMARLGGDSLCLLVASGLWVIALNMKNSTPWWVTLGSGVLLGIGLLTKAFFLPLGVGFLAFVFLKRRSSGTVIALAHTASIAVIAGLIGLRWYAAQMSATGAPGIGNEIADANRVGILAGLLLNFHAEPFFRSILSIASTAVWAGTWSFTVYHAWLLSPLLLLPGIPIVRWLFSADIKSLDGAAPLFFVIPLLAGLIAHELAWLAIGQMGPGSPGWYFHILAGPLSYAWSRGLKDAPVMRWLFGLTLAATVVLWGCQLAVFSGSALPDASGHLAASTAWWRIDFASLSALGFPILALVCLAAVLAALAMLLRMISTTPNVLVSGIENNHQLRLGS